uniref:Candidate secreted effector n=1 Tax=Meloidogyne incognita TaxID=6306 RepID=A0A914MHG1_MELIC
MPKTMCAIFASPFPVPGAVSSIICFIFLIYSGATILFCCKKSKAQKKRVCSNFGENLTKNRSGLMGAPCVLIFYFEAIF